LLPEVEVHVLTPKNWRSVVEYAELDFILFESCFESVTGDWYMGQIADGPIRQELTELRDLAAKKAVPTVYWFTKGKEYHSNYFGFVKDFDHVYCADPESLPLMREGGISAKLLLPAFQPRLFNPYKGLNVAAEEFDYLYDGIVDLLKKRECFSFLKNIGGRRLGIVDSNNEVFEVKVRELQAAGFNVLGSLDYLHRAALLRCVKGVISAECSVFTRTEQQWLAVEVAACRVPQYFWGDLADDDIRKPWFFSCGQSVDALIGAMSQAEQSDLLRQQACHVAWRDVHTSHTIENRLRSMCSDLNFIERWPGAPKATVILPTYRKDFLSRCIGVFREQTYANKELVIVYNGDLSDLNVEALGLHENERIVSLPGELSAGACLNLGYALANGSYTFRMDDDDYYGSEYLADCMLHLRANDADLYGKPPKYCFFEESQELHERKARMPALRVFDSKELESKELWLGGNTIGVKKSAGLDLRYPDASVGTADTYLAIMAAAKNLTVMSMDALNVVASRRADLASHTWSVDEAKLKVGSTLLGSDVDLVMI